MLNVSRAHDFQVHLSPSQRYPAAVNPPSFNWPENIATHSYRLELKNITTGEQWHWDAVNSPMQLSYTLPVGDYQWRLVSGSEVLDRQVSEWVEFQITETLVNYIAPTAKQLFALCEGREQWLMYFDEDIEALQAHSADAYRRLKKTALLSVPIAEISYPKHYLRGQEEGKREAIANVRKWIDRDLMTHTLLYKIWGEEQHGVEALNRLLLFAEWSPEGPASLLRPCTWGDEVGCSLARNLFLAYHWLSPLLTKPEKELFIKPMLVRIARQMVERLEQDNFKQYPGHSHTSRLPAYLGIAALTLYREHNQQECEQWLNEALTIYRGILPFYGGVEGSWVEGAFYASTYSKWFHPLFLSIERLSAFSFYDHPFYQNFIHFAADFIAPEQDCHPFGDGFWCHREGKEWPGFFAQNPLRIYAARFGNERDQQRALTLENTIEDYRLHLLDVIPTVKQIEHIVKHTVKYGQINDAEQIASLRLNRFYQHAGLGKLTQQSLSLYYRASLFGNSSHRHGDQGNLGFFDKGVGILVPTGSYGYRFGSKHHSQWTRQTVAHNLPLIDGQGQKLNDLSAIGHLLYNRSEANYHIVRLALDEAYPKAVTSFIRTLVLVDDYGLIIFDEIVSDKACTVNWRLHSPLQGELDAHQSTVLLRDTHAEIDAYQCALLSDCAGVVTLVNGYEDELSLPDRAIESDASQSMLHLDWLLPTQREHNVLACCIKETSQFPCVRYSDNTLGQRVIELQFSDQCIIIPHLK